MLDKRHLTCRLHVLTLLNQQMLYIFVRLGQQIAFIFIIFYQVKDPVLSIMPHALLNNRSLAPVQSKVITEVREAQWTIRSLLIRRNETSRLQYVLFPLDSQKYLD